MMKRFRNAFNDESGFTLIELLVVIAVLGILASIAVPRLTGVRTRAEFASGKSALGTINTAMGMYYAENGKYFDPDNDDVDGDDTDTDTIDEAIGIYVDNYGELINGWTATYTFTDVDDYSFELARDVDGDGTDETLTLEENGTITEG